MGVAVTPYLTLKATQLGMFGVDTVIPEKRGRRTEVPHRETLDAEMVAAATPPPRPKLPPSSAPREDVKAPGSRGSTQWHRGKESRKVRYDRAAGVMMTGRKVDHGALAQLAASSMDRDEIRHRGYMAISKVASLHPVGYQIVRWVNPYSARPDDALQSVPDHLFEFVPRGKGLPRITAETVDRADAVHRALGVPVPGKGELYEDAVEREAAPGVAAAQAAEEAKVDAMLAEPKVAPPKSREELVERLANYHAAHPEISDTAALNTTHNLLREFDRRQAASAAADEPTPEAAAAGAVATAAMFAPTPDLKRAEHFRKLATAMQADIDRYHNPGVLNQNQTRRRSSIAAGMIEQGDAMERVQSVLMELADHAENGTLPPALAELRHRSDVELILRSRWGAPGLRIQREALRELVDGEAKRGQKADREIIRRALLSEGTRVVRDCMSCKGGEERSTCDRCNSTGRTSEFSSHLIEPSEEAWTAAAHLYDPKVHHRSGWLSDDLKAHKAAKRLGLHTDEEWREARSLLRAMMKQVGASPQQRAIFQKETDLLGQKIPGYFPTPDGLSDRLVEAAEIAPGMKVLEPSAGKGNIVEALRRAGAADADVDVGEFQSSLREILALKGANLVAGDFLGYEPGPIYDRIVQNPPFEHGQDVAHVRHAYELLKPGGRLVSIMGEHAFFASDATSEQFREWLRQVGGSEEKLPERSFMSSSRPTGVNTRLVVIDKPGGLAKSAPYLFVGRRLLKSPPMQYNLFGGMDRPKLKPGEVEKPGSRGGKWYRTETGKVRYGEKPDPVKPAAPLPEDQPLPLGKPAEAPSRPMAERSWHARYTSAKRTRDDYERRKQVVADLAGLPDGAEVETRRLAGDPVEERLTKRGGQWHYPDEDKSLNAALARQNGGMSTEYLGGIYERGDLVTARWAIPEPPDHAGEEREWTNAGWRVTGKPEPSPLPDPSTTDWPKFEQRPEFVEWANAKEGFGASVGRGGDRYAIVRHEGGSAPYRIMAVPPFYERHHGEPYNNVREVAHHYDPDDARIVADMYSRGLSAEQRVAEWKRWQEAKQAIHGEKVDPDAESRLVEARRAGAAPAAAGRLGERRAAENGVTAALGGDADAVATIASSTGAERRRYLDAIMLRPAADQAKLREALVAHGSSGASGFRDAMADREHAALAHRERIEEKRDRIETAADKAAREAESRFKAADRISERFWGGQPILVGHHSERKARRDQERMHNNMRAGIDAQKRAAELAQRAEGYGEYGISALHDPNAAAKLDAKAITLDEMRDAMTATNKLYRKLVKQYGGGRPKGQGGPPNEAEERAHKEALAALPEPMLAKVARHVNRIEYSWDRQPFAGYTLTNLGARLRAAGKQAEHAERVTALKEAGDADLGEGDGWHIRVDTADERIHLKVASRLPKDSYQALRRMGWKWSPTRRAFVNDLSPRGRYQAEETAKMIRDGKLLLKASPYLASADLFKAHVKEYTRTDSRTGQQVQVKEHDDKRLAARGNLPSFNWRGKPASPGMSRVFGSGPEMGAPQQRQQRGPYLATFHTEGPDSPGHTVRLQPHPQKQGVMQIHPEDRRKLSWKWGNSPVQPGQSADAVAPGGDQPIQTPQMGEPHTAPPPGDSYAVDPTKSSRPDGVADAARVGVPGGHLPPPPPIPRLPNLAPDERRAEEAFATAFMQDPDAAADHMIELMRRGKLGDAPNIFATDEAKNLSGDWNPRGSTISKDERMRAKALYNTSVHQTANAIAKRAFSKYLREQVATLGADDPKRHVLVTAGGVAAGKGYALENVEATAKIAKIAGAVWDSAGEQNGTETPWVVEECRKLGIPVTVAYVHADPTLTWENPKRGVVQRALEKGRMVDARVFSDSYSHGPRNFHAFAESVKDDPNVRTFVLDNRGEKPAVLDALPPDALAVDAEALYKRCLDHLHGAQVGGHIKRGGSAGTRIWGPPQQ